MAAEGAKIVLDAFEAIAGDIFVEAEGDERNHGGQGPELRAVGEFCFRFPAKELREISKETRSPRVRAIDVDEYFGRRGLVGGGSFEARCQVGGGQKRQTR